MGRGSPWHGTGPDVISYTTKPEPDWVPDGLGGLKRTGDANMPTAAQLERTRENLLRALARADKMMEEAVLREAERDLARERFQEDDFEEGAVITFARHFPDSDRLYNYAAIKADGQWWLTGRTANPMPWAVLVERHLIRAREVAYVDSVIDL